MSFCSGLTVDNVMRASSVMQISGGADSGIWFFSQLPKKFYLMRWFKNVHQQVLWLTSGIRVFVKQDWIRWREGGKSYPSILLPPFSPLRLPYHERALVPAPQGWVMLLAKVVERQPKHVIGAHPCIINIFQDKTLVKSHDGIIICLWTKTQAEQVNIKLLQALL